MIRTQCDHIHLKLLPLERYIGVDRKDPIRFYRLPVIGRFRDLLSIPIGFRQLPYWRRLTSSTQTSLLSSFFSMRLPFKWIAECKPHCSK